MKIAILGSGGVGGLLAAVTRPEVEPLVVTTPRSAERINREGLRLESRVFGPRHTHPQATTLLDSPVDFTFLTVKQTQLADALAKIPPELAGTVIPLHNGLDHIALLRQRGYQVNVAAIRVESSQDEQGTIIHGSDFVKLTVSSPIPALFDARLEVTVEPDEAAVLWSKLTRLAPFALLTTRYRCPLGEVLDKHREELEQVVAECAAVSLASGGPDFPLDSAFEIYESFAYGAKSSMLRDAEAGRPLELDAIGGAVLRHAQARNVDTPVVAELVRVIREG